MQRESDMIRYKCPHCRTAIETEESLSGKQDTCPECGKVHTVPLSKEDLAKQKAAEKERRRAASQAEQERKRAAVEAERVRIQAQRQVLASAPSVPHQSLPPQGPQPSQQPPPEYGGVKTLAVVYAALGMMAVTVGLLGLCAVIITAGDRERSTVTTAVGIGSALFIVLSGVMLIGFGQLFECIRDIARNSFHLRPKP